MLQLDPSGPVRGGRCFRPPLRPREIVGSLRLVDLERPAAAPDPIAAELARGDESIHNARADFQTGGNVSDSHGKPHRRCISNFRFRRVAFLEALNRPPIRIAKEGLEGIEATDLAARATAARPWFSSPAGTPGPQSPGIEPAIFGRDPDSIGQHSKRSSGAVQPQISAEVERHPASGVIRRRAVRACCVPGRLAARSRLDPVKFNNGTTGG